MPPVSSNAGVTGTSLSVPSSGIQLPMQMRHKLTYATSDPNPARSIDAINEMIRKNELKIKTSNKRLFSDISLHNSLPPMTLSSPVQQTTNPMLSSSCYTATNKLG